ncbi:DUF3500 domain-containing protein [Methylobacterium fujisawaense]
MALTVSVALCALIPTVGSSFAAVAQGTAAAKTQAIATAATAFLNTLNDEQRGAVEFPFTRQAKATAAHFKGGMRGDVDMIGEQYGRSVWSNYPVSDVLRPGLRLGSLNDKQHAAAMALLGASLSDRGYRKMQEIMGSDQALADSGTPYASGRAACTLAIFGKPGVTDLWMVQFGGHHLALNVTMLGEHGVLAPVLTGCLPAIYEENGKRVRALAAENDKAFALLASFNDAQRKWAIIDHPVSELALGPGHDGETVESIGVKASTLTAQQRAMLFDLVLEWAGIVNDTYAAPRLAEIRDGLSDTFFAWSGPTTHEPDRNGASYFRIHGPKLFIEFSPQQPGGDLTMHVHTIYRDPPNAYGRALAA